MCLGERAAERVGHLGPTIANESNMLHLEVLARRVGQTVRKRGQLRDVAPCWFARTLAPASARHPRHRQFSAISLSLFNFWSLHFTKLISRIEFSIVPA